MYITHVQEWLIVLPYTLQYETCQETSSSELEDTKIHQNFTKLESKRKGIESKKNIKNIFQLLICGSRTMER